MGFVTMFPWYLGLALWVVFATGCSNLGQATMDMAKAAFSNSGPKSYAEFPLRPDLVYLEVHTKQSSALLVLAASDGPEPTADTWVGAGREIIRLQQGFPVFTRGVRGQWPSMSIQAGDTSSRITLLIDAPAQSLYRAPLALQAHSVSLTQLPNTDLSRRAAGTGGLQFTRWSPLEASPHSSGVEYLFGVDLDSGLVMYGRSCIQHGECIEYLRRTSQRDS